MSLHDRLESMVEPLVTGLGLELFDLTYAGGTLTILVQRPLAERDPGTGSGVDIAAITAVTRAVSKALDAEDPISGSYSLEVSTPGLERPLRTPAHFAGALGETVSVKAVATFEGPRRIKGELAAVGDGDVTIRADGDEVTIALVDIDKARTVFDWGPEPKPGSGGRTTPKKPATKKVTSP